MHAIICSQKARGYETVCIIGSDSPDLPRALVLKSFQIHEEGKADIVLGPSIDGGYYLVGFSGELPPIFDDINWGTEAVFSETVERLKGAAVDYSVLPYWYDVDTIKELRFLEIGL